MNPEFTRNIWLQFSAGRLLLVPVVIGAVLLLTWLATWHSFLALRAVAEWIFYVVAVLWGTRRAADLVAEEIAGGTWDSQRMSALGAWQMTWGKFLGGTSYVWYAAGLVLIGRIAAAWLAGTPPWERGELIQLLQMIGTGLFGQAVSFVISLALLRKQAMRRKLGVTVSQLAGLLASVAASGHLDIGILFRHAPVIDWFFWRWPGDLFALASLGLFLGWSLFGAYRLMRVELQFRSAPWAWIGFTVFLMLYAEGLLYPAIRGIGGGLAPWLSGPFAIGVSLTYVALFLESKDVVRYRWFLAALAAGERRQWAALLPQWLPVYVLAAVGAVLLSGSGGLSRLADLVALAGPITNWSGIDRASSIMLFPIAVVLYLLRDVLVVLFFNFGAQRGRADLTAFICLMLVYFPLSGILVTLGQIQFLPLLVPSPLANPIFGIAAPFVECAVLGTLVLGRLNAAGQLRPATA
ncbi:MAG: hypothetical protein QOK29_1374 [Rhodospirillaceae bacterium]|jgi:hypothetical protein|nr:hypothetical protein [Rhodospirillaceae bacterium]